MKINMGELFEQLGRFAKKLARVYMSTYSRILFGRHLIIRCPTLGWPLAISQEERLSYCVGSPLYAGQLGDFIDWGAFNLIYFCIMLPASGEIASRDAVPGTLVLQSKILLR